MQQNISIINLLSILGLKDSGVEHYVFVSQEDDNSEEIGHNLGNVTSIAIRRKQVPTWSDVFIFYSSVTGTVYQTLVVNQMFLINCIFCNKAMHHFGINQAVHGLDMSWRMHWHNMPINCHFMIWSLLKLMKHYKKKWQKSMEVLSNRPLNAILEDELKDFILILDFNYILNI